MNNNSNKAVPHSKRIANADTDQFYQSEQSIHQHVDHSLAHQEIEIPFNFRHCCWFCQEPSNQQLLFPSTKDRLIDCPHQAISVPICRECKSLAKTSQAIDIYRCREQIKKALAKRYQKDLAIGKNWTKEELANAGFEGGSFEGFAKSGWMMFEIARDRVNFSSWPLWCNGEQIEDTTLGKQFAFDGVTYSDLNQAVDFYVKTFNLHKDFFLECINIVGVNRFGYAIRFARLYIGYTTEARREILKDLSTTEKSS
ncbi:hypothetical protein RGQ13_13000 [Thalassotalea psychrophila]|uniref:Uncharacterized protein n=1 Tax=Thalassotalea psychrophila TaxID=3065647 RepID=A0ABY9TQE2_9GAMM|nr:hypothetical protein RGQ13_13000 [Colwelliaceae bacterium SQ149]